LIYKNCEFNEIENIIENAFIFVYESVYLMRILLTTDFHRFLSVLIRISSVAKFLIGVSRLRLEKYYFDYESCLEFSGGIKI